MRVVVTGASGFVGRSVCLNLTQSGVSVVGVGRRADPKLDRVEYLRVSDYATLRSTIQGKGYRCIHLAGENVISRVSQAPDAELQQSLHVARGILDCDFESVIYVSSGAVYGDRFPAPRTESDPADLTMAYARLKYETEQIFLARGHGVARLANVYGAGMSEYNVLSHILKQLACDGDLRVRDGAPVRDYVHVHDVAAALVLMARKAARGLFNVGTGVGTSVSQLADLVLASAGQGTRRFVSQEPSKGQPSTLVLDPSRLRVTLGWTARVSLADGLERLVKELRLS